MPDDQMELDLLISNLRSPSARNKALGFLTNVIVGPRRKFVETLVELIRQPDSIEDTNRFASLLKSLSEKDFIEPLIETISLDKLGKCIWLSELAPGNWTGR